MSEFGTGFIYNLILFAKHFERARHDKELYEKSSVEYHYYLFFNGASDHFYDLKIPKQFKNTEIGKLALAIKDKSLNYGHGEGLMGQIKVGEKEYLEVFADLEKLALMIDEKLGVKTSKAEWN